MNTLFIANIDLDENEGIYKKVLAQSVGLKNANDNGWLITKRNKGALIRDLQIDVAEQSGDRVLDVARKTIINNSISIVYIRHMIPGPKLVRFLRWLKKRNVYVFYEIPTYPYFAEQYRTSKRKHRAIAKIGLDILFWPIIYHYINKLVVIKSNSRVKMYKKMVEITNGVRVDNILPKSYENVNSNKVSMVAVGTLYPYHGYDRILEGLKKYIPEDNVEVEFHIIGESPTIQSLKTDVMKSGIDNVFFHGIKTTEQLNILYEQFDIGLGSVALHRRNADIDTTLKVIEYYCRGIVVVTSGKSPMDQYNEEFTIHVPDTEEPICINSIVSQYKEIEIKKKKLIAENAKRVFSWDYIMRELCCNIDIVE